MTLKWGDIRPGDLVVTMPINIGRLAVSVVIDNHFVDERIAILWLVLWDKEEPWRANTRHTTFYQSDDVLTDKLEVIKGDLDEAR